MKYWKSILFSLFYFSSLVAGEGEPFARILLYKSTETNPVVEQKDFVISYQVINTGEVVANNIEIADKYDPKRYKYTKASDPSFTFYSSFYCCDILLFIIYNI